MFEREAAERDGRICRVREVENGRKQDESLVHVRPKQEPYVQVSLEQTANSLGSPSHRHRHFTGARVILGMQF